MDGPISLHTSNLTDTHVDLTFSEGFEQGAMAGGTVRSLCLQGLLWGLTRPA